MDSGYSSDIASAKLQDLDRKVIITPQALIQCLSVVGSYSEETLLVLSFLYSIDGELALQVQLQGIKEAFIIQDFKEINRLINEIFDEPHRFIQKQFLSKWSEALEELKKSYSSEIIYPKNQDNSSRRMFESILGQRYLASDIALVNVQKYFPQIKNTEEMSEFFCKTLISDDNDDLYNAWRFWHEHWPRIQQSLDRGKDTPKKGNDLPQVRTPGILTYKTPRPMFMYDKKFLFQGYTSQSDKNRLIDFPDQTNWVKQNPENPFVASYSGHALFFVGMLIFDCEMIPVNERQHFFDTMLKTFIAAYLSQGFHSLKEMYDMINEPKVLLSINNVGIEVNLGQLFFGPNNILDQTFDESIAYNTHLLLGRAAQVELKKKTEKTRLIKEASQRGDLQKIIELREKRFSQQIPLAQVLTELPKSPLSFFMLCLFNLPKIADTVDISLIVSLYQKGLIQDEDAFNLVKWFEIDTSSDSFYKKSSELSQQDKKSIIEKKFFKLKLACLKGDIKEINLLAVELFKAAGTIRNKFSFSNYSTSTHSALSLIKVLLQPENEGILKALGINDSKDIETQLIEMMNKAFKNEDIVLKTLSKQGAEVVKKLK